MQIVSAEVYYRIRGFEFAVKLDGNDIEILQQITNPKAKKTNKIQAKIKEIINFACRRATRRTFTKKEKDKIILIQVGEIQWDSPAEAEELESILQCAI